MYFNFYEILTNFFVKFVHPSNDYMSFFIIFGEVLGIIIIILKQDY
jgi:hypothetical protein